MRDIVYFLSDNLPQDGAELRYSLRSLVNLPHRRVIMVAPRIPDWVKNVDHFRWKQKGAKYFDLQAKYKALHRYEGDLIGDDVYIMDDDIYITKPKKKPIPLYWNGLLEITVKVLESRKTGPRINHPAYATRNTYELCLRQGWEKRNIVYPIQHTPYPVTRSELPVHLDDHVLGPYDYKILNTNYRLNEAIEVPERMKVPETKAKTRRWIDKVHRIEGFLSSGDDLTLVFEKLEELFPEAGDYEIN